MNQKDSKMNQKERYEVGFGIGYSEFNEGSRPRFFYQALTIMYDGGLGEVKAMPEDFEYAKGYIEGYIQAESDSHD